MERFQQLFNMPGRGQGGGAPDAPVVDTAEKLHISSLALLKMLKHGEPAAVNKHGLLEELCWRLTALQRAPRSHR